MLFQVLDWRNRIVDVYHVRTKDEEIQFLTYHRKWKYESANDFTPYDEEE